MRRRDAALAGLLLLALGACAAPIQPTPRIEWTPPSWDPLSVDGAWTEPGLLPDTLRVEGDRIEIRGHCEVFRARRSGEAPRGLIERDGHGVIVHILVDATIEPSAPDPHCPSRRVNIGALEAQVHGMRVDGRPMVQVVLDEGDIRQPDGADLTWRGRRVLLSGNPE